MISYNSTSNQIIKFLQNSHSNLFNKEQINFIDIGSVGDLPSPWNNNLSAINKILKFEPRGKNTISKNKKEIHIDKALWSKVCTKTFYEYQGRSGSGSSFFKQNYKYVKENEEWLQKRGDKELAKSWYKRSKLLKSYTHKCTTLDQALSRLKDKYHFLKIDAQGAEFQILQGSEIFLRESCLGLHLELYTIPLYKNMKLMGEVIQYLNHFGFKLIKVFPAQGSFASQNDSVFIKDINSKIVDKIKKVYKIQ